MEVEERLIVRRQRRERQQEYKDLAAKSCYSVIIIVLALILLRPLMVDQILSRADAYSAVGQLDESKRQCDKALLIDNNSSEAWCQLARIHRARGDREMAYGACQKAVQADSTNKAAHFELGRMYMEDERHPLAIPSFEQVRRLTSDRTKGGSPGQDSYHRAALNMLVQCYQKAGDPIKAELALKEIRLFYPGFETAEVPQTLCLPDNLTR